MYLFGGNTILYGLANDLYVFNPIKVTWTIIKNQIGGLPCRRAGHVVVVDSDSNIIFVFGGRGYASSKNKNNTIGLNDLWTYNPQTNVWTSLTTTTTIPSPRQYVAAEVNNNNLYIFGGINPVNNMTYNDVWVYNNTFNIWQQLFGRSISPLLLLSSPSFYPPPLHSAQLIPITTTISFSREKEVVFLLYGGIG